MIDWTVKNGSNDSLCFREGEGLMHSKGTYLLQEKLMIVIGQGNVNIRNNDSIIIIFN